MTVREKLAAALFVVGAGSLKLAQKLVEKKKEAKR